MFRLVLASLLTAAVLTGCAGTPAQPDAACDSDRQSVVLKLLAGDEPTFAPGQEPLDAGYTAARCTITAEGATSQCKLIYAVPGMGEPFLQALKSYRFAPPLRCGRTASVETVLRFFYAPTEQLLEARFKRFAAEKGPSDFTGGEMTPPKRLSGRSPQYTEEMVAQRVQGQCVLRCTVTEHGRLEDCFVLKPLPGADEAIIDALRTWQMTPVMFGGKPLKAWYTFNVNLRMPE